MNSGLRRIERTAAFEPECDGFKVAMRRLACGVAVITVGNDPDITGFTATSVISLSVKPARLLVSVSLESDSWKALQRFPYYGVNLLHENDSELADRFAGRTGLDGTQRFAGRRWTTMVTGTPMLDTALAAMDCEVEEMLIRHDHAIVIGRVRGIRFGEWVGPLVYWQAGYHCFERVRPNVGAAVSAAAAHP